LTADRYCDAKLDPTYKLTLSAFDIPRTGALVNLLTRGQIAQSFAQIFLISHSCSFDPDLFGYYVRMEEGRVTEANLPRPARGSAIPVHAAPVAA